MKRLIYALVFVLWWENVMSCPQNCSCTTYSEGLRVDCDNRRLTEIPSDIPGDVYRLVLRDNKITEIDEYSFSNLSKVFEINLDRNRISTIPSGVFKGLPILFVISIRENIISVVERHAFTNLPVLNDLFLNNNNISVIQESALINLTRMTVLKLELNLISTLPAGVFTDIFRRLFFINLDHNLISTLPAGVFTDLDNLFTIRLQYNKLKTMGSRTFKDLPLLYEVSFQMYCDCTNVEFWKWIRRIENYATSVRCYDHDDAYLASLHACHFDNCSDSACTEHTCSKRGSCYLDKYGDPFCSCVGDWTGPTCSIDPCYSNPCSNNGDCTVGEDGRAFCTCNGLWTGQHCEVSPCSTQICDEGQCYYNESGLSTCVDPLHPQCADIACTENTCLNGGSCYLDNYRNITCSCVGDWTGPQCSIDPCYSNPCSNNGDCTVGGDGRAFCTCHGLWTGQHCEGSPCSARKCDEGQCYYNESGISTCVDPLHQQCAESACTENTCLNGGSCYLDNNRNITCSCVGDWAGPKCSIDPCYSNPCSKNGDCTVGGDGRAFCTCHGLWTGQHCEGSPCNARKCDEGQCYYNESGISTCVDPLHQQCAVDPCYSNPCSNNGDCTVGGDGRAFCTCHGLWTGQHCEVSPCSTRNCGEGRCYYNESGLSTCFDPLHQQCPGGMVTRSFGGTGYYNKNKSVYPERIQNDYEYKRIHI